MLEEDKLNNSEVFPETENGAVEAPIAETAIFDNTSKLSQAKKI